MKERKKGNYLVQEFDKNIQGKGIPNRIIFHLSFARLVVGNWNEVFELFKLHFPKGTNAKQFGREVVSNIVVLAGSNKQKNEKDRQLANKTKKTKGRKRETHQLTSFIALRKTAVQFLWSMTMQSTDICQSLLSEWCLLMCSDQAVKRWFPSHTKNILPTRWARSESFRSIESNSSFASCHKELQELMISSVTWRTSSRLL